jgi:hypothetical protein
MNFKEWFLNENMWGNIPSKTRKPSDGWRTNNSATVDPQQAQQPQMMKKMKGKMKK